MIKKKNLMRSTALKVSVNVRQGCCFCASTFYFKAVPNPQSMELFHNIETEGQIWSMRCAMLSVELATKTAFARHNSSVCAVRQTCSMNFWFLAVFTLLATAWPPSFLAWCLLGRGQAHLLAGAGGGSAWSPNPIFWWVMAAQQVWGSRGPPWDKKTGLRADPFLAPSGTEQSWGWRK